MKRKLFILPFLLGLSCLVQAQINKPQNLNVEGLGRIVVNPDQTWQKAVLTDTDTLVLRSQAPCDSILLKKFIRNRGEGQEDLHGVRNMRTVLKGVLYRGGGNNRYNPVCARDNNNPLSTQMVFSMKTFGFSEIVYLYARNFGYYFSDSLRHIFQEQGVRYESIVPHDEGVAYGLLKKIHSHIKHPASGPIYVHCWNGWHMSGLVSAYALMQFCNFSNKAALEYWKSGTDNNHVGYDKVKNRILSFKSYSDLDISAKERARICPCVR